MTLQPVRTVCACVPVRVAQTRLLLCRLSALLRYGLATSVLVVCGPCEDARRVRDGATRSAPEDVPSDPEELYIAPFLPGPGVPVAFYRHAWDHVEAREMSRQLGVPFDAGLLKPYSLEVAIWRDGTMIWSRASGPRAREHYEAKVGREAVQRLLGPIDTKRYRTPDNVRYSEEARLDPDFPAAMIVVVDGPKTLVSCSNLDQMELVKEYWYRDDETEREYPFAQYSFEQFCDEIPESYSQHLKDYRNLRRQFRSMIPKEGKRIDLNERLRWVVLRLPKGAAPDPPSTRAKPQEATKEARGKDGR